MEPEITASEFSAMEINFETVQLAILCNNGRDLQRKFGKPIADTLKKRLNLLSSLPNLAAISPFSSVNFHFLYGDRAGQFAVNLDQKMRLVFVPDHEPVAEKPSGGIDLTKLVKIRIIEIVDYH